MASSKKQTIAVVVIISMACLLAFAVDRYILSSYGINLLQYVQYSSPLSEEEEVYLKENSVLSFVSDKNAPPFAYIDEGNNQYKGLVLDYVNALSIELGVEIRYLPEKWEDAIKRLSEGRADFCDMFPSANRQEIFSFSDPIYRLRGIVLTGNSGVEIQSMKDLYCKKVGVPSGDYAIEYINDGNYGIDIIETRDIAEALDLLLANKIEAVIGDEPVIFYVLNSQGINDQVRILHPPLYEQQVSLAVKKENKILLSILNKGIFQLKRNDTVEKIQQKWFGLSVAIKEERISKNLVLAAIFGSFFFLVIFAFYTFQSHNLKNEVRKRTKDLFQSKQNLQHSLDALSAYLVLYSFDGSIINANSSFCKWVNLNEDDLIGKSLKEFPLLDKIFLTYSLDKPILEDINQEILKEMGRVYSVSVLILDGETDQTLIVADDITDQIVSQQQMVQQNKMIAVGHLAAGVAHEIRNPLGNVRNYAYILKKRVRSKDPVVEEAFSCIDRAVERAGDIIDNLLHFSRAGDDEWAEENLYNLLKTIISLEQMELTNKNISVEIQCSEDITIYTKSRSMHHIILNLVSNAIDSLEHGGRIKIGCSLIQQSLLIDFIDNGAGIPKHLLESIFNPFFTTKDIGQGTGLGLYIVYNEIQKMGGEVKVRSKVGKGTTFHLAFPIREAKEDVNI
ncbi:MAG: transporter substrate-binding domain-containing protein [Clostridia bacterium]|nr:transporter substrate-binding domain-containing protein [Clostridia bacterium]